MSKKKQKWGGVDRVAERAFHGDGPILNPLIANIELTNIIAGLVEQSFKSDFVQSQAVRALILSLYHAWLGGKEDRALGIAELVADRALLVTGELSTQGIIFDADGSILEE